MSRRKKVDYLLKLYIGSGKQKKISKKTMNSFYSYDWAGNVRELQNVIQRFVAVNEQEFKGPSDLDFLGPSGVKNQEIEESIKNAKGEIIDFRMTITIRKDKHESTSYTAFRAG